VITVTVHDTLWQSFVARIVALPAQVELVVGGSETTWGAAVTTAMRQNHEADAHAMGRYENQTMQLTQSIRYELLPPETAGHIIVHPIKVVAEAPYAWDVEVGVPGHSRPYPYFWKEIMSGEWSEMLVVDLTARLNELLASTAERA
jgi:hypothetical protein